MTKLIIPITALLLTSCTVTDFYQVYKTESSGGEIQDDHILFEDDKKLLDKGFLLSPER